MHSSTLFRRKREAPSSIPSCRLRQSRVSAASIIDPNAAVREEYTRTRVRTRDGRIVTGAVQNRDDASITLVNVVGTRTILATGEIADERVTEVSAMPEGLLDALTRGEVVDLFAWLQSVR